MPKRKCSNIDASVGLRMRYYRIQCGLTQQQVADALKINRTTYTKYETGVSEPSHELLGKIVKMFGIDYNAILDNRDYFERRVADGDMTLNVLTLSERAIIARSCPRRQLFFQNNLCCQELRYNRYRTF